MPIISNTLFTGLADRLAAQAEIMSDAARDAQVEGGGFYYPRIHQGIVTAGDFDVENALIASANALDENTLSGSMFTQAFTDSINAHESHVAAEGASNLDAFLNTSGLNVDVYYEEVFFQVKGTHLDARNVFKGEQIDMGTVTMTSSGVGTFTDGEALGTGTGKVAAGNHAAGQIHAVPQVSIGGTDLVMAVQLLAEDAADGSVAASRNVTIPNGSASGDLVSVGTSGVDEFLDVTDVILAGGTSSDQIKFLSVIERSRAL